MRPWAAFVVVALVAGCADDAAPADGDRLATAETGLIRGVAVDQGIRPLGGVNVSLRGQDAFMTTGPDGAFLFVGLEPGTYVVTASRQGYLSQERIASVVAGVEEPDSLSLVLTPDAESAPYYEVLQFAGFIECGTSTTALCAVPNYASTEVCSATGVCLGNINADRFTRRDEIARLPHWLQTELIWESTQPISDRLQLTVSHWTVEDPSAFESPYDLRIGPSPLLITVDAPTLQESGLGGTDGLQVSVWSGDIEGTTPPVCFFSCAGPGFAIQQKFDAYTHLFYNMQPAQGWRFSDDPVPR